MLTHQFAIWLQGFLEACGPELTVEQTSKVREKLDSIFIHSAESVHKPTLEELGEQHGFSVKPGWPGETNSLFNEEGVRC